jgi:hypothetical protein
VRFAKQFPNVRVNAVELDCTDTDLITGRTDLNDQPTGADTAIRLYIERGYAGDAVSEKGLPCSASVAVRMSLRALAGSPIDFWELQPTSGEAAEGGAPHGLGPPPESRELSPWWWRVNTVLTKIQAAPHFSSPLLIWIICSFESSSSWSVAFIPICRASRRRRRSSASIKPSQGQHGIAQPCQPVTRCVTFMFQVSSRRADTSANIRVPICDRLKAVAFQSQWRWARPVRSCDRRRRDDPLNDRRHDGLGRPRHRQ